MIKTFQSRATIDELQGVAGFGYWEWDLTTDEVSWSQGMYYLLGVESQSVQPGLRYVLSMLADDDKEKVVKQITSSLQKEENAILILKILRPDGGIRVIKSTSSSVFREGKAVKLTGFMQDITDICDSHNPPDQNKLPIPGEPEDRKRAELIQKNTEAMAHIGSWQFCVKTQHVHWSDELFRIFGFEPGQIQPSLDYYLKVTHPDERDRVKKILDEAFLKPGQYSFMRRIMTAQGKISHIHSRISVLRHELNADLNIIGTCQDVTPIVEAREDLIKSEEELRESCEFINRVAETSPYIIYVRDIVKKKIVYTNRELVHLLGYNNEDLTNLGSNAITSLMHPEDFVKLPDWISKYSLMKDGETLENEYRVLHKMGTWRWIHTRETIFKRNSRYIPTQVLGIAHDITVRKENEEENTNFKLMQQKEILNAVLRTQEDERKRIAESLHNGLGQLLYGAKIEMEQFADLNKARKAGKAIWKKINMLIDEAIDATRTISFELTPSILEDFGLEITLKELCKKLTNKKLRLNCELEGLESRFERDLEIALFRISQELINNIIKHSQAKEGLIKISNKNGRITVVAQDNGKGFEAAVKTEGQGLRNIKNRVKLLNGQIEIKSEISKGTTITINLFLL